MGYAELKELGIEDSEIRDTFWESNSEAIGNIKGLDVSDDELFSIIKEKTGMSDEVLFGTKETTTEEPVIDLGLSDNKYLTEDIIADTIEPQDVTATQPSLEKIQYNIETSKEREAMVQSFVSGAKKLPIGISVMAQDFSNWVMDFDDEFDKEDYYTSAKQWAIENQEAIEKYNKTAGFKKDDILTPDLFGQITAELFTLPAGGLKAIKGIKWLKNLKTTTQAALVEGAVATVTAKGEAKEYGEAVTSGVFSALGTKVGGELLTGVAKIIGDPAIVKNLWSGKASDKQALDYLVKASGETEGKVNEFYSLFAEATGKNFDELTPVDKMQAIVKNSEAGSKFKTEAEYYGEDVLAKTHFFEQQVQELFDVELKGADIPAKKLDDFLQGASENYGKIKDTIIDNFDTDIFIPKKGLDSIVKALRNASTNQNNVTIDRVIGQLEGGTDTPLGIEELMNLKKDMNSLNLSGVKGWKAGEVGSYIDNLVDAHFMKAGKKEGKLATKLWKQANVRYAQKKAIEEGDNWLTTLIQKKGSEDITTDDFANSVLKQDERGAAKFNQLKEFIGEDGTAEVEKQIIKNIFEKKEGLNSSLEYIQGFDFVTAEGKQLRDELIRLEGVIPKKDSIKLLQSFIGTKDVGSVGWSDNLIAKFKFSIIGKAYNAILTRLPSATPERAFRTLGDRLKEGVEGIKIDIKKDPSLQKAFSDE